MLAVHRGDELHWAGNCGTGFDDAELERLLALLRPLERETSPFPAVPRMPRVRRADVVWVEPRLVCEVEFAEWTADGRLRAPSYKGLREDKPPAAVRREHSLSEELRVGRRTLRLSNLDKVFWPEDGITKGDLLDYYRRIAPSLVPHLRDRPFTMKRYPGRDRGRALLPEERAVAHAGLDPDPRVPGDDPQRQGHAADPLPARERRAGAALDGEHGLHRPQRVAVTGRPARPARRRAVRPRSRRPGRRSR